MATHFGTGRSLEADTRTAAANAASQAKKGLDGAATTVALVFAGPNHDLGAALACVKEELPQATVAGCTTAGEFTSEGLTHGGLVVAVMAGDFLLRSAMTEGTASNPGKAAAVLLKGFEGASNEARSAGMPFASILTLVDGLNGAGERLVTSIGEEAGAGTRIVGGAAGDEGQFKKTEVGLEGQCAKDGAVALSIFGRSPLGVGMRHGLIASTDRLPITRAKGNIVHEIGGRPAFEMYRDHARARGIELSPADAGPYMITYELGIYLFGSLWEARAPLAVNADGSLTCAGDLAFGQQVCILEGTPEPMIMAARAAAREAKEELRGAKPAGVLVFDCICRGLLLKKDFSQEIRAIQSEMGDVPIAGWLTYGEIARYGGSSRGWHNTTAVVVAIPQ